MSKRIGLCAAGFVVLCGAASWAAGAAEADSADRGRYVAEQGMIIPPAEVVIDSYIASIDYEYPDPAKALGVYVYTGHRQASLQGQEEIIQMGLQGKRTEFEDLPVLNLAFVFDKSGSMSEPDKILWVKEAFALFMGRLRSQDIVSVVAFDDEAEVLLRPTVVGDIEDRGYLIDRVDAVLPGGRSDLTAGLLAGYRQVAENARPEHVNRVVLISDGLDIPDAAFTSAETYKNRGITLSTVTLGMNCDLNTMVELAREGAGSSRFLSSHEDIDEHFNTDLDRMVVPIAYDLEMELELLNGTELLGTWGYRHEIDGATIRYSLPALHHRDYETIVAQVRLPPRSRTGSIDVAAFSLEYEDKEGTSHREGPYLATMEYADSLIATGGISDPVVLKSGTMLHTALGLKSIGVLYYSCSADSAKQSQLNPLVWHNTNAEQETPIDKAVAQEQAELPASVRAKKQRCFDVAVSLKKEIQNTRLRLDEDCFENELTITEKYIEILGRELSLGDIVVARMLKERELETEGVSEDTRAVLQDLVQELVVPLDRKGWRKVAFFGFTPQKEGPSPIKGVVDDLARSSLGDLSGLRLIRQASLDRAVRDLELTYADLIDNDAALRSGREVDADYVVSGTILDMPGSTIVFGKVLDAASGNVASVAQVVLPKADTE